MKTPEMFIVAGPPGAGKSSVFPLGIFAARVFNADDRAAELNGGSYREIPLYIRHEVNREFNSSFTIASRPVVHSPWKQRCGAP